jgi:hypothetical protein
MASYKIVAGNFSDNAQLTNKNVGKSAKVTEISSTFGIYSFCVPNKFGANQQTDTIPTFLSNIEKIEEVTENNKVSLLGAAGWGVVGGVLTGGIGILAGAILGGRGKTTTFAIRLKDGSQFLCTSNTKAYVKLLGDAKQF